MNHSRHLGIFDPTNIKNKWVHIFGCGNIGSHTAIALTRLGVENFYLYDFDKIEDVNVCTQNFTQKDINKKKTTAIARKIKEINPDANIKVENKELKKRSKTFKNMENNIKESTLLLVSGVDSMAVRKTIKDLITQDHVLKDKPIIDGRIGKEQVEILTSETANDWDVNVPKNIVQAPCTEKYIVYTPLLTATLIAHQVKEYAINEKIDNKEILFNFKTFNLLNLKK